MSVPLALLLAVQVAQSGVSGTVRDEFTGHPLAGALMVLSDLDRKVLTDREGRFGFDELFPGPHHLTITRQGFESRTLHALVPRTGQVEVNVALQPALVELEGLVVEPRLPISGVEDLRPTKGPAEAISLAAVRNHPLLAEADVFRVLEGGDVTVMPESPAGLHVRGGASSHTAYELDGIPVLAPFHAAGLFSAWNPDALTRVYLTRASSGVLPSLSGTVVGVTRAAGGVARGTAAVSTTHARMTVDGPLSSGAASYMFSVRSGFPSGVVTPHDPERIRGESGDLLAKVELQLLGGGLKALVYESENELTSSAIADPSPDALAGTRNGFEWRSQAFGATWERTLGFGQVAVRAWDSGAAGSASLLSEIEDGIEVRNDRSERGVMATLARTAPNGAELLVGARLTRGTTLYHSASSDRFESEGALSTGALLLGYDAAVASGGRLRAEVDVTASSLGTRVSPLFTLKARLGRPVTVSAAVSRRYQFVQSMRNEETVLGAVFPADLFVSAGSAGVPTARADEATVRVDYRPLPGLGIVGRTYVRALESVVFVAPRTGSLFSSGAFDVGSANVKGISVDVALSGSRYGVVADYGFQRVQNRVPERAYVPSYAPAHRARMGVVYHASPTMSLRLATTGIWGRRATALDGAIEWEACSLADGVCELAGAPPHGEALGESRPGPYMRTDLGLRKHWHVGFAGRDAMLSVYGTLTNILNRTNTLNFVIDPLTGATERIDLRPFSPLVIGVELAF